MVWRPAEQSAQCLFGIGDRMGIELRHPFGRAPLALGRPEIEKAAAGDGALGCGIAQNEAVAASVLADRPGFEVVRHDPSRLAAPLREATAESGVVRVLPGATNDGFSLITIRAL